MCHLKEDVKAHSSAAFASAPCKICFDSIDWKVTLRLHSPPPSQIGVAVTFNMFEINLPVLSLHFAFFFFFFPPYFYSYCSRLPVIPAIVDRASLRTLGLEIPLNADVLLYKSTGCDLEYI